MDCGHEIVYRYTGTNHAWGFSCECGGMFEPDFNEGNSEKGDSKLDE